MTDGNLHLGIGGEVLADHRDCLDVVSILSEADISGDSLIPACEAVEVVRVHIKRILVHTVVPALYLRELAEELCKVSLYDISIRCVIYGLKLNLHCHVLRSLVAQRELSAAFCKHLCLVPDDELVALSLAAVYSEHVVPLGNVLLCKLCRLIGDLRDIILTCAYEDCNPLAVALSRVRVRVDFHSVDVGYD